MRRTHLFFHAIIVTLLFGCKLDDPLVAREQSYIRGDNCAKVALDINELTRGGGGSPIVNAVDAAYMKRIAQAGPKLLRIDVREDMLASGVLEQMVAEFNTSERARFTLAIGEGVAPSIVDQKLENARSTCEFTDRCRAQNNWIADYITNLENAVTGFICEGLRVVNVETFPRPNAPSPGGASRRIHADWFVELLTQVFAKHATPPALPADCNLSAFIDCPAECAFDACDPECTCTSDCAWRKQWSQIQFVSGPFDGSNSEDLRNYILDEIRPVLNGAAFPADKIGLDVRNVGLVAGGFDPAVIEDSIDTVRSAFGALGSPRNIDVIFGWTGQSDGTLATMIEAVLTGDDTNGDGIGDGGLENDEDISQAYFSFLHSTLGASGDQQDGIFLKTATGSFERRPLVGDKLQEQACLNNIDYVFVFDTTGSMGDDIDEAKASTRPILNDIIFGDPLLDPRVALVEYRDFAVPPIGDRDDYLCRVGLRFTDDKLAADAAIQGIVVQGGGDTPEAVYSGLMTALDHPGHIEVLASHDPLVPGSLPCLDPSMSPFRPSSERIILLFGDAPPHIGAEQFTNYTVDNVVEAAHCPYVEVTPDPSVCEPGVPTPTGLARSSSTSSSFPARIFPIQIDACTAGGICPEPFDDFQRLADGTGGRVFLGGHGIALVDLIGEVIEHVVVDPPNQPPRTEGATPSLQTLWPPNHDLVEVAIEGVSDPEGQPVTIMITGITQDEPVDGPGNEKSPDAFGLAGSRAVLRAERSGDGNGRVYRVNFIARDERGVGMPGSVEICVPHDEDRPSCVDDGQAYNSMHP